MPGRRWPGVGTRLRHCHRAVSAPALAQLAQALSTQEAPYCGGVHIHIFTGCTSV